LQKNHLERFSLTFSVALERGNLQECSDCLKPNAEQSLLEAPRAQQSSFGSVKLKLRVLWFLALAPNCFRELLCKYHSVPQQVPKAKDNGESDAGWPE